VTLPIVGRAIPVVADDYAKPEFGTGVVKITPAHDANDFEVGRRHGLPAPVVIDAAGYVREVADAAGRVPAALDGLERFEARARIVEMLRAAGRLVKVEEHQHASAAATAAHGRRAAAQRPVVRAHGAARRAGARRGARRAHAHRARALGGGVRPLAREHPRLEHLAAALVGPPHPGVVLRRVRHRPDREPRRRRACPRCGGAVRQDEDVLDTWFSSWLWPMSTLGWPDDESADLRAFYPTDVLVTAPRSCSSGSRA
jgi:valyl-tRNA synthetase